MNERILGYLRNSESKGFVIDWQCRESGNASGMWCHEKPQGFTRFPRFLTKKRDYQNWTEALGQPTGPMWTPVVPSERNSPSGPSEPTSIHDKPDVYNCRLLHWLIERYAARWQIWTCGRECSWRVPSLWCSLVPSWYKFSVVWQGYVTMETIWKNA